MRNKKGKSKRDIPVIAANLGSLHMEISGNREVIIEGNRGIIEYNENSIKINAGKYIVAFCGRGLHIKCMNECDVVIRGFITSVEYIM